MTVVINGAVAALAIPFIVGRVGADGWAAIAAGQAVGGTAAILIAWGWGVTGPAEVAASSPVEQRAYFLLSLRTRLLLAAPIGVAAAALAHELGDAQRLAAATMSLATAMAGLGAGWFFIGRRDPRSLFLFDTFPRAAATLLGVLALLARLPVEVYPVLLLIAAAVGAFAGSRRVLGRSLPSEPIRGEFSTTSRRMLRRQASTVLGSLLVSTYSSMPVVIVAAVAPRALPVFALADRLLRLAVTATAPIAQVAQGWVPSGESRDLKRRIRTAITLVSVVGLCGSAAFAFTASAVGEVLTRGEVSLSATLATVLAAALCASIVTQTIGLACLVPLGRSKVFLPAAAAGAVAGLTTQAVLIPTLGALGGLIAVCAAETAVLVVEASFLVAAYRRWSPVVADVVSGDGSS